jgi:hypothetical protein
MEGPSLWLQAALAQWLGRYGASGDHREIELKKMEIERIA